jgi:molecular chaperone GrpE
MRPEGPGANSGEGPRPTLDPTDHEMRAAGGPGAGASASEASEDIERLRQLLEDKTREAESHHDRYLRAVAEFDNARKRAARDREEYIRFANEALVRDVLPVLDNFDRALDAARLDPGAAPWTAGVELIHRELLRVLEKVGVTPFTAVGERFDPARHEAVARVASDQPDMTVLGETQRGYLMHGRVLRPAMVTVAMAADAPPDSDLTS